MKKCISLCVAALAAGIGCGATVDLAQTVTVAGTGILELKASERCGEASVWRVGGNGRVLLDESVRQTCGELFLTDIDAEKPRRPGRQPL